MAVTVSDLVKFIAGEDLSSEVRCAVEEAQFCPINDKGEESEQPTMLVVYVGDGDAEQRFIVTVAEVQR